MPIVFVKKQPVRYVRRRAYFPAWMYTPNESFLIPYRLSMWTLHFMALICVSQGSDKMIREASLAPGYRQSDYVFLRHVTNVCLAVSFLSLFFQLWGVVSGRTLRYSLDSVMQGSCHCAAAVLLIVAWQATAHVARIWHVFYIFTIIPTGFEGLALAYSYRRGIDVW